MLIINLLFGIAAYVCIGVTLFSWEYKNGPEDGFITPKWFYNEKKLNWFGSWVMFILLSIFSPLGFIIKAIYSIYWFFKWLFTIGR